MKAERIEIGDFRRSGGPALVSSGIRSARWGPWRGGAGGRLPAIQSDVWLDGRCRPIGRGVLFDLVASPCGGSHGLVRIGTASFLCTEGARQAGARRRDQGREVASCTPGTRAAPGKVTNAKLYCAPSRPSAMALRYHSAAASKSRGIPSPRSCIRPRLRFARASPRAAASPNALIARSKRPCW